MRTHMLREQVPILRAVSGVSTSQHRHTTLSQGHLPFPLPAVQHIIEWGAFAGCPPRSPSWKRRLMLNDLVANRGEGERTKG